MPFDATPVTNAIEGASAPWRDVLLRAADIMERRGGCKGSLENYYGQVCALGAISAAVYGDPLAASNSAEYLNPSTPFMKAIAALCYQIGAPTASLNHYNNYRYPHSIAMWNNREDRPVASIIATMREAAKAASHH